MVTVALCCVPGYSLHPHWLQLTRLICPWDFQAKNTGVGCIFSSREPSQPRDQNCVPCIGGGFSTTEPLGKPKTNAKVAQPSPALCDPLDYTVYRLLQARLLEWVAFPFSRGSSQPKDQTQASCIAGGFFTSWATREAQEKWSGNLSLPQGLLPTQELNWGLLHRRRILYQLSYQWRPIYSFPNLCFS